MREIPGFYYDEEKKRYFKVESSRTAPATSAWSSDSVKRRKLESTEATAALQRLRLERGLIKRSPLLSDPLVGGVYVREHGVPRPGVPEASYAKGFVEKGSMPLKDARWGAHGNLSHLCVAGADWKTGLGVAYAKLAVAQVSDIKYHESSQSIFIASRKPGRTVSIWRFKNAQTPRGTGRTTPTTPEWLLGVASNSPFVNMVIPGHNEKISDYQINLITPAPPSSPHICAIGTNRGILQWDARENVSWLAPPRNDASYAELYRDVFAIDYLSGNPGVLLAGGRPGHFTVNDIRDGADDTRSLSKKLASPITHIKSLDDRNALVSCLRHDMAVYDLRMLRAAPPGTTFRRPAIDHVLPTAKFPDYRNGPHVHIGLDIDRASGIVAAAHEDGSVALYSTRTGHRLKSPDIDQIRSHRGVVRSLQFQTMPGDANPTLFAGLGSNLHAYSFGVRSADDEA